MEATIAYPIELRERVVKAYRRDDKSTIEVAEEYSVGSATLTRWLRLERETGSLEPREHGGGRTSPIDEEAEKFLRRLIAKNPDVLISEMVKELKEKLKINTSESAIGRALARMEITRKKKELLAEEKDTEEADKLRAEYWKKIQEHDMKSLVFIDESSANLAMVLLYGWGEKGDRVPCSVPFNRGENITMLGALNPNGLTCMMTVNGATDGDVFLVFVRNLLVPTLSKGQVVVLDNLAAHKVTGVREAIEATGAKLLYLPPYSPEFNPIEKCWSKVKNMLRKAGARTRDALDTAIGEAMKCVSSSDAIGWFSACGYL